MIETTRPRADTPLFTAHQCSKKISQLLSYRAYLTIIGGRWRHLHQRQKNRHHPKKKRTSLICIAGRIRRLWRDNRTRIDQRDERRDWCYRKNQEISRSNE